MANYKEIVTKAVIAKGKKSFTSNHSVKVNNAPSTILGCWVINHNFNGIKNGDSIIITGSYDVNIWYSYDNDTKTEVIRETNNYQERVNMRPVDDDVLSEEIIVRSLKQPSVSNVVINGDTVDLVIEKELGVEVIGDTKIKVSIEEDEDDYEEINDDEVINNNDEVAIDEIDEEYLK